MLAYENLLRTLTMPPRRNRQVDENPPEQHNPGDEDLGSGQGLFNENISREELLEVSITY